MRMACDDAETQLALTGESSKVLLERAGNLRDERYAVQFIHSSQLNLS